MLARRAGWFSCFSPLLDESAQDDLEAHGELELHRRLAGEDARPAQDVLGQNEEHSGAVLQ
jgi:hypothetical protein